MGFTNTDKIKAIPGLHQEYIKQMNCSVNLLDLSTTVACLQEKSVEELMDNSYMFDECNSMYLLNIVSQNSVQIMKIPQFRSNQIAIQTT